MTPITAGPGSPLPGPPKPGPHEPFLFPLAGLVWPERPCCDIVRVQYRPGRPPVEMHWPKAAASRPSKHRGRRARLREEQASRATQSHRDRAGHILDQPPRRGRLRNGGILVTGGLPWGGPGRLLFRACKQSSALLGTGRWSWLDNLPPPSRGKHLIAGREMAVRTPPQRPCGTS